MLKPGIKQDPAQRWALPDRIFYGHGACHILAGVYLEKFPELECMAFRVIPQNGYNGNHIFISDGTIAFDYHGYSVHERLVTHHKKIWTARFPAWSAVIPVSNFIYLTLLN